MELNPHIPKPDPPKEEEKVEEKKEEAEDKKEDAEDKKEEDKEKADSDEKEKKEEKSPCHSGLTPPVCLARCLQTVGSGSPEMRSSSLG